MSETQAVNLNDLSADDYIQARKGKPVTESATETIVEDSATSEEVKTVPDSESGDEGEVEEKPKPKGKGGFQNRIDKLTKDKYDLMEKVERLELEAKDRAAGKEAARAKDEPKKPKMDDYDDLESYVNALSDFNTQQKIAELKAKESEESEQQSLREIYDSYNEKVAAFSAEHDDFEEVVGRPDLKIPQGVQLAILEMDNGPEVAYFLGSNPDICKKLAEMRPVSAVVQIGKIAAKLESPSPKAKPASTATEPIKPVSGSARSARPLSEVDDADEYMKRRRAEKAANRRN